MAAERIFLIIRAPNGEVREMPLGAHALVLGRDESADIRVDDKKVSRRHASFKLIDGEPWVEDLGSSNGVRLNGKRIDRRARITGDDKVRVGGFHVSLKGGAPEQSSASVVDPPQTRPPVSEVARTRAAPKVIERAPAAPKEDLPEIDGLDPPVQGRTFVLHRGENIVGRLEECDVPILDGSVSRQHARLVYARDRVTATDLGSSNGIFVNGVRVDMAELAHGDKLKIGSVHFDVRLPAPIAGRATGPVETRARPKAQPGGGQRWVWLGVAGLISAALVLGGAYWWKTRGKSTSGATGLLAGAGLVADGDAPEAPEGPDEARPKGPTEAKPNPTDAPDAEPDTPAPPDAPAANPDAPAVKPGPEDPRPTIPPQPALVTPRPRPRPAAIAAAPKLGPTGTATSPYSRRGEDGLPLGLPSVDPAFDFDAFVAARLDEAKVCEKDRNFACLREAVKSLLATDPINPDAQALLKKAEGFEKVQATLAKADRLVAKGRFGAAHALLLEVAREAPEAEEAQARAEKLRALAIEDELARAAEDGKRKSRYQRAHGRYLRVLELDPKSEAALAGIRKLERKMRKRKMEFAMYEPPIAPGATATVKDVQATNDAISSFYGGEAELTRIAQAYARGAIGKGQRRAKKVAASGRGANRRRARQLIDLLSDLKRRYDRTRTEVSNDPDRAWSMLLQFEKREREVLPEGVTSFLARELQVSLSEAFAERGASMFDRGRDEEAFQRWLSGFKLDATNPKVRAGLERLERKAETLAREAELASQRGDPSTCEKWKQVTKITRAQTDAHKKARERALALCR